MRALVVTLVLAGCGSPAVAPPESPRPPPPASASLDGRIAAQQRAIETFFRISLRPYQRAIVADHRALAQAARERWKVPDLPCWAVAMGTGTTLLLLDPAAWAREACDHARDSDAEVDRVIAHELAHVLHGQQRPADPELEHADDVAWFVEGLATYASGQLTAERFAQVRELIAAGTIPKLAEAWSGKARYAVAGSLVRTIDLRFGRAKLRALLDASTTAELLGRLQLTEPELLAAWQQLHR